MTPRPSLLHERENQRQAARLDEYEWTRQRLQTAVRRHLPGQRVWLFGSPLEPGRFHAASDVDLAVESLPAGFSLYTLMALLDEELGRPVDVVVLPESRLRGKILCLAEPCTTSA